MSDWNIFVQSFIERYYQKNVILGVFNEPDIPTGVQGDDSGAISAANYCNLFTAASGTRNSSGHPTFALAGPETFVGARQSGYLYDVFGCLNSNNALAAQDIITVHWYDGDVEPAIPAYVDGVRVLSGGNNDIWISEIGAHDTGGFLQAGFYNAETYLFASMGLTRPWLSGIIFYRLQGDATKDNYSILNDNYSTRPAYVAYQNVLKDVTGHSVGTLKGNGVLGPQASIHSTNGAFLLQYRSDGNLVEYYYDGSTYTAVWSSNTSGTSPGQAVMQTDGNFVVYDASSVQRWNSGTSGHPNAYLVLEDDGAIFIYSETGAPLWAVNDPY